MRGAMWMTPTGEMVDGKKAPEWRSAAIVLDDADVVQVLPNLCPTPCRSPDRCAFR
ncbi:p-hydroxycinnamoyl CoA hydratase/lyase [Xanthomonas fragariae]|uniref:p-hydroxycinnamoyl CoA hydratase/lyase n=1 Tax=Xanthomonas fragariae TaxID=48664 RepID=A0A1Y6GYC9_9XANT|nr:p-hydroxycinnamoyl CoA hydratase/lyase [Xanthomonas fragariae]SMR00241.1 hypothetical protein PD885_03019 [Xanthomonas fragariae]SMR02313.1 p-hydroxycinnamoyl CoA hydratase/lyase [Xanthomonas fragariae]